MKVQHTPGPWHTAGDQGVQIRSAKDQIAKVWTMRGNEWKANARLIAAAPDLLAALSVVLRDVQAVDAEGHLADIELEPAMYQARAAIAKATGELK